MRPLPQNNKITIASTLGFDQGQSGGSHKNQEKHCKDSPVPMGTAKKCKMLSPLLPIWLCTKALPHGTPAPRASWAEVTRPFSPSDRPVTVSSWPPPGNEAGTPEMSSPVKEPAALLGHRSQRTLCHCFHLSSSAKRGCLVFQSRPICQTK